MGRLVLEFSTVFKIYNANKLSLINERNLLTVLAVIFIFLGIRKHDLMILAFLKCWHRTLF